MHSSKQPHVFHSLVQQVAHGYQMMKNRALDAEEASASLQKGTSRCLVLQGQALAVRKYSNFSR